MTGTDSPADLVRARGFTDSAWARRHTTAGREILPSRRVWRGPGRPGDLPASPSRVLDDLSVTDSCGRALTLPEPLAQAETDAH
ncbi:hypothetical protein ACWER6_28490 [Streptomyces sp. NPDC004009]